MSKRRRRRNRRPWRPEASPVAEAGQSNPTMTLTQLQPDGLYTPLEVADMLRFTGSEKSRTNRVYAIPREELPRIRVGPRGGKAMFQGRDILAYLDLRRDD